MSPSLETPLNQGMVWNGKWNGTEISVWNMEDARMEWNGMEDFKNEMEDNFPYSKTPGPLIYDQGAPKFLTDYQGPPGP